MSNPAFRIETIEAPLDEAEREIMRMIEARHRAYLEDVRPLVQRLANLRATKPVRHVLIPDGHLQWELPR